MINNKKGLSTIVTTLIIILLVLAAVAIVWGPVRDMLKSSTEKLSSTDCFELGFTIKSINADGQVFIQRTAVGPADVQIMVSANGETTSQKVVISPGQGLTVETGATELSGDVEVIVTPFLDDGVLACQIVEAKTLTVEGEEPPPEETTCADLEFTLLNANFQNGDVSVIRNDNFIGDVRVAVNTLQSNNDYADAMQINGLETITYSVNNGFNEQTINLILTPYLNENPCGDLPSESFENKK